MDEKDQEKTKDKSRREKNNNFTTRFFQKRKRLQLLERCNGFSYYIQDIMSLCQCQRKGGAVPFCLGKITQQANTEAKTTVSSFTFGQM